MSNHRPIDEITSDITDLEVAIEAMVNDKHRDNDLLRDMRTEELPTLKEELKAALDAANGVPVSAARKPVPAKKKKKAAARKKPEPELDEDEDEDLTDDFGALDDEDEDDVREDVLDEDDDNIEYIEDEAEIAALEALDDDDNGPDVDGDGAPDPRANGVDGPNPVRMNSKLRRDIGEEAADCLDEYALSLRGTVLHFFEDLKDRLDLGDENDDDDDDENEIVEILQGEVGRRGMERAKPHFGAWREHVMKALTRDMANMFRAPEPEVETSVTVEVPEAGEAVIDGVDERNKKAGPVDLNRPVQKRSGPPPAKKTVQEPENVLDEDGEEEEEEGDVIPAFVAPIVPASGRFSFRTAGAKSVKLD